MDSRQQLIHDKLTQALQPTQLTIIDESAAHAGHAGARSGAGHYRVQIAADCFHGLSTLECHRKVYAALDGLIGPEIHALAIEVLDQ